jgi:uncharacterized protein YebE (UPF0316 family)
MQKTLIVLAITLIIANCHLRGTYNIDPTEAKDFALGFLVGMGASDKVTDGFTCVNDITPIE